MATCEELTQQITDLTAALIVDDAAIEAANNIKTAHQMSLWYAQYNFMLQGCGGTMAAAEGSVPDMLYRTPEDMKLIERDLELLELHKRCMSLYGRA